MGNRGGRRRGTRFPPGIWHPHYHGHQDHQDHPNHGHQDPQNPHHRGYQDHHGHQDHHHRGHPNHQDRGHQDHIHSKSEKVCGVCFSVTRNLRKKCVNLEIKISRQKYVNQ